MMMMLLLLLSVCLFVCIMYDARFPCPILTSTISRILSTYYIYIIAFMIDTIYTYIILSQSVCNGRDDRFHVRCGRSKLLRCQNWVSE